MNPFLQSVVARPVPEAPWHGSRWPLAAGSRSGRHLLRHAMGVLLVTAGLGVAAPPARALDVNQASAQQLENIRGIGPRTAEIIVRERERGGKFESLDDLAERVRGIGQKKAQALQAAGLQVGATEAAASAKGAAAGPPPATRSVDGKPADVKAADVKPGAPKPEDRKVDNKPAPRTPAARVRP